MGIDFSHGDAHWSYSGFNNFRNSLVKTLGYTTSLHIMYEDGTYVRMQKEPIYPLINHSDCDGVLTVKEMQQVLPQLKDIVNCWPEGDYDKVRGLSFIDGIEEAINENESLEFI